MGKIDWIKVNTDIFSNRKIKILLKDRNGDTYFRMWIQLLVIAGECNQNGGLYINENTPFTVKELSKIVEKTERKLIEIMEKFIQLGMVSLESNIYSIKNWSKYQSADKLEKIRLQNNERQKRFREKNKEKGNVNLTLSNAREKETEFKKEGESRNGISKFQMFN